MLSYREVLASSRKYCERYLEKCRPIGAAHSGGQGYSPVQGPGGENQRREQDGYNRKVSDVKEDENESASSMLPGTMKELLAWFTGRNIAVVVNGSNSPERIHIRRITGELLVAETEEHEFKFIDMNCICEAIISGDELLESLIKTDAQ